MKSLSKRRRTAPQEKKLDKAFDGCYTSVEVKARFKELVLVHHPDRGGTHEGFLTLQAAKEDALNEAEMNEVDGF